jgi:RNA-binding protein
MDKININTLKKESVNLPIIVRIGKTGLSESIIDEINKHLKKRKLIKIKFLKTALIEQNIKELSEIISIKTSSTIVSIIGLNVVFYKCSSKKDLNN